MNFLERMNVELKEILTSELKKEVVALYCTQNLRQLRWRV